MTLRSKLLLYLLPTLVAFVILIFLFFYFDWSHEVILWGAITTLFLVIMTVFFIADRITEPVEQLNEAALAIAASNYEVGIDVKGPKEIVELANSLNTMRECLAEHINRLRERSLLRERMYGEYECGQLLQDYMLRKVIDEFTNPAIKMKLVNVNYSEHPKGLLFEVHPRQDGGLKLCLFEALEPGFQGLFKVNRQAQMNGSGSISFPFVECEWSNNYSSFHYKNQNLAPPLIWSIRKGEFIENKNGNHLPFQNMDLVFLYNSDLADQFSNNQEIYHWFGKVLRHFDEDGLDIIHTMLTNELNFLAKREWSKRNFQIICIQLKKDT